MIYRVVETQEFDIEADSPEEANEIVRDGISHTKGLLDATRQFFVSDRTITDPDGEEHVID